MISEILNFVKRHEDWRGTLCLNLIPSENVMSPSVRSLLSSDLCHRYTARDRFYMGTRMIDEIEQYGEELAKNVFEAETADLRPLSGHIADMIFLGCLTKPNDSIACVSPRDGGYPGVWQEGLAGLLGLKPLALPFSKESMNIDVEKAKETIRNEKPKVVVFGASFIIFPHPVKELADAARESGSYIGFDGSHVLGLIAGKKISRPFKGGSARFNGFNSQVLLRPSRRHNSGRKRAWTNH